MLSKEKFDTYQEVRHSGLLNMCDIKGVVAMSEELVKECPTEFDALSEDDCKEIMFHFKEYFDTYAKDC